jgi:PAS domain S-box-containing protein
VEQTVAAAIASGGTTVFGGFALTTTDTAAIVEDTLGYCTRNSESRGRFVTMSSGHALETLWEDGEFVLSRGVSDGEPLPVLSAAPSSAQPWPQTLARLQHAYTLREELDPAWAARPLKLEPHRGRLTLWIADPGGEPLSRLLGRPWEIPSFLRVAISLASALGRLHERGLVHKDVKPANILVKAETDEVWLTGFGIASRLPRERQAPAAPEVIAGTLAYMAPEQTGRMNRSVDSRSDFYALGVTFYEMLTGTLPFTAAYPMEWVHCHIARQPAPPSERSNGIPASLSAIVMKLLAKSAEDRYQTAAGLEADLRRCQAEREAHGRIKPFPLGAYDLSERLLIPEKLYGRGREIDTLLAAFDRVVAEGATELVLVSGYSGIGKTSVVNELHKALVPPRGLFASGKFDQYKRDIPYATLAQAFQSLVRHILGKGDAELDQWRGALWEALGANGGLIVNLVPELELLIGEQPPVPDLPPQDAKNRFQMVFRRFLGVFARKEHPLALFLDDLQWLDAATLDLIEHLTTHSEAPHLLLVAAYRDNEVGPAHPLLRTFDAIRKAGASVHEIVLSPLRVDDVGQLIADALHCKPARARPLAQLVHEKTGGNPFFAIQFLASLAEEGLLAFDPVAPSWRWDVKRIRTKAYTDNIVELMAGKLKRLSGPAQEALKQLACLGNVAEVATLARVHGETEEAIHATLWEAVHAGLVFPEDGSYKFLHDRIQQAAYSLIPDEDRADVHLRIGRALLARTTTEELAEHLFDIANQFNRSAAQLIDRDEKVQVARINLRIGRKAKAAAAYASANEYLAAGMALLDERCWASHYELMFSLRLERAACEFLTGEFEIAERLLAELLERGTSKVDLAAAYVLYVQLHVLNSENQKAVVSALTCLRLFDIDLPAHPSSEQVQAEYETVWQTLDGRPIESLIDLPPMTNPELQAAVHVLAVLAPPAYFTDFRLFCLLGCRKARIVMRHGMSDASSLGHLGVILGPVFHRYEEGYRFAKLACDLVDRRGFTASRVRAYHAMARASFWTQPIATAIDFLLAAFRTATETGELTWACYGISEAVASFFLRNDPLDAVWRESERCLDFVRKAGFQEVTAAVVTLQRFIATMQGRTTTFSTFSDAQFDEVAFEAQLTGSRTATTICLYWILKLQSRFLSGDYAEAFAAADKAKALLWSISTDHRQLNYHYYSALTMATLYEQASPDERSTWREILTAHRERLREWAESYPPTFADKHALVSAEIARLEERDADAMRLYEQAIRSAREHGFVKNEGVALEVAARFYEARGFETFAHAYLRNARYCYLRWGAEGKVRQLERLHPHLREQPVEASPAATIGAPAEQLDIGAVFEASQAVSGEILLDRLIETLMRIALEHAGAQRGLLVLMRGDTPQVEAEATTEQKTVVVTVRQEAVTLAAAPESLLHTVIRTKQSVIVDDASAQNPLSADPYLREKRARSVLCLPLLKQTQLIGVLYLENNLASHVFTPARISLLKLLASQAAISLENARLYRESIVNEKRWRQLFEKFPVGVVLTDSFQRYVAANPAFQRMTGYSEAELRGLSPLDITHEDDLAATEAIIAAHATGEPYERYIEKRYRRRDGGIRWAEVSAFLAPFTGSSDLLGAVVVDVTEHKHAEEALRVAQTELAHAARLTTLGQLTASIAHEINQPLAGISANGEAALIWLNRKTPDLNRVRDSLSYIVQDSARAGDVIRGLRALAKKSEPQLTRLDIDDATREVLALTRAELQRHGVVLHAELAAGDRPVLGDRVQLQQVLLNLIMNGVEAMRGVTERKRELIVSSTLAEPGSVLISVEDAGTGLDPAVAERIFEPFFTTKSEGLGMGLSICRSIVEAHRGRLWASPREPHGAAIRFTVPVELAQ